MSPPLCALLFDESIEEAGALLDPMAEVLVAHAHGQARYRALAAAL